MRRATPDGGWDLLGEGPSLPGKPSVFSVSELTRRIRFTLERSVGYVWVEGEISNLTYHTSGHIYFTLKDAQSQVSAVMFRGEAARLSFRLEDGQQVQVYGRVTVYEKRGNYQIVVETAQPAGLGRLQAAFEALKRKLQGEGLFEEGRKRSLPTFPRTIGVVTSPDGAALRDFCRILNRRFAGIRMVVAPVRVQGEGAAAEIAAALDLLNSAEMEKLDARVDVIAIIRGGGSIEDLWAFNEEEVARAVARSDLPTISGVGHEVDFTICDFVADVRAATPSAAAELIIRSKAEFVSELMDLADAMGRCARISVGEWHRRFTEAREAFRAREPRRILREWRQRLDEAMSGLQAGGRRGIREIRGRWEGAAGRFQVCNPKLALTACRGALVSWEERLEARQAEGMNRIRHRVELARRRLDLLSPRATLARGYSITLDAESGRIVKSAAAVIQGQRLRTQVADGEIQSAVEKGEA